jgi:AsmA protein
MGQLWSKFTSSRAFGLMRGAAGRSFAGRGLGLKVTRITAIGVAAVAAIILLILTIGVPSSFLVEVIQKRFEAETGYRLRIADGAKIGFLPSLTLTVNKISIADNDEPRPETHLTADSVRIKLSLPALLTGRPRLTEVAIVGPIFNVPLLRERTAPLPSRPSGAGRTLEETPLVDRFVVENGAVAFVNQQGQVESRLDRVELQGSVAAGDLLTVKGSGRAGEQTLLASLKGQIPQARNDGRPRAFEFTFEAPGLLRETARGTADVRTRGSLLSISSFTGAIGSSSFNGSTSVDFASKPFVKMEINLQRLDLSVAEAGGAGPQGSLDQPWSDKTVALDGLNFFDAEVQITAAQLNIDRFRFAPITVGAILTNGVLTAGITRTGTYGGHVQGTFAVDASSAALSHALRIDLVGVRALPLLSDVANFTAIDGIMQAKIDARGKGASLRAVMSTLGGAVDVLVQDGEIRNLNVAKMIRTLGANVIKGWQADKDEKTDMSALSALFRIENGKAMTDNLRLLGPLVRVTGAGTVDLGAKTLNFRLDPKLVLSLEGQGGANEPAGFGVPIVAEGTWGEPRIYPDMSGILDDPQGAYSRLNALGAGLFGNSQSSGQGGSLMQGIDSLIGKFGGDSKSTEPADPAKPSPPPVQTPPPAPSQAARPRSPPAQEPQNPIDFFRNLFSR